MKKYGPEANPEAWDKFNLQIAHWARQGTLVRDGLISARMIAGWWGRVPIAIWEKFEPIIVGIRGKGPYAGMYHEQLEDLYYQLLEERKKEREDFINRRAPLHAEKRKALGLKPIPTPP
jgi:hypothetical protein